MKKVLDSRFIKKTTLSPLENAIIQKDLKVFNTMKRTAFVYNNQKRVFDKSIHCQLKEEFHVMDYYANSANRQAIALISSWKELNASRISDLKEDMKEQKKALDKKRKTLKKYEQAKCTLMAWTRKQKELDKLKLKLPGVSVRTDGMVFVCFGKNISKFDSVYDFEHQYLEPRIAQLKDNIRQMTYTYQKMEVKLKNLSSKDHAKVYFGGKNNSPEVRKERRDKRMQITGSCQSPIGNYVFSYDPVAKTLRYRSMTEPDRYITFGHVEFPYGQDILDATIAYNKEQKYGHYRTICWEIEDCGNAWHIHCVVEASGEERKNDHYGDGCIGIDMNYDNLSFSETDAKGNLLYHKVLKFDLHKKSSGRVTQILSLALEEVFRYAREHKKPIVMEEIKNIRRKKHFDKNTKRTRRISMFACSKMQMLADSKSDKYGIAVTYINPAYISFLGKIRYRKRYGLSVHESASFVIARHGMGYEEHLPAWLLDIIPDDITQLSLKEQYKKAYNFCKKQDYKNNDFTRSGYSLKLGILL